MSSAPDTDSVSVRMPVSSATRACTLRFSRLRVSPTRRVGTTKSGRNASDMSARRQSSVNTNTVVVTSTMAFCATSTSVPLIAPPTPCTSLSTWLTASPGCCLAKNANGIACNCS